MSDDKSLFNKDLLRDLEDPEFLSEFIVHSKRMSKNRGHDSVCPARNNVAIDFMSCTYCELIARVRRDEWMNWTVPCLQVTGRREYKVALQDAIKALHEMTIEVAGNSAATVEQCIKTIKLLDVPYE